MTGPSYYQYLSRPQEKGPTNTGHCTCQVYAGWSEMKEYYTLKKLNMRIGRAEAIMDEMNFTTIFDTLENATARLTVLEDNINKQAVAASVTELFGAFFIFLFIELHIVTLSVLPVVEKNNDNE